MKVEQEKGQGENFAHKKINEADKAIIFNDKCRKYCFDNTSLIEIDHLKYALFIDSVFSLALTILSPNLLF